MRAAVGVTCFGVCELRAALRGAGPSSDVGSTPAPPLPSCEAPPPPRRPSFEALLRDQDIDPVVLWVFAFCRAVDLARAAAACRAWRRLVAEACAPRGAFPLDIRLLELAASKVACHLAATQSELHASPAGSRLLRFGGVSYDEHAELALPVRIRLPGARSLSLTLDTRVGIGVRCISCGQGHSLLVTLGGDAYAWGDNGQGELGLCLPGGGIDRDPRWMPTRICARAGSWEQSAAGDAFSFLRDAAGAVCSFGDAANGCLGRPSGAAVAPVPGIAAADVAAGNGHGVVATLRGELVTWGGGYAGQLGFGGRGNSATPLKVTPKGETVWHVAAGDLHTVALCVSGSVYHFGERSNDDNLAPTQLRGLWPAGSRVARVIGLPQTSVAITDTGDAYLLGSEMRKLPLCRVRDLTMFESSVVAVCEDGLHVLSEELDSLIQGGSLETVFIGRER